MISSKEKKNDMIELQETTDNQSLRMTSEEERKIISKEYKNLKYVLNNSTTLMKYSWEIDGNRVIKLIMFRL